MTRTRDTEATIAESRNAIETLTKLIDRFESIVQDLQVEAARLDSEPEDGADA